MAVLRSRNPPMTKGGTVIMSNGPMKNNTKAENPMIRKIAFRPSGIRWSRKPNVEGGP